MYARLGLYRNVIRYIGIQTFNKAFLGALAAAFVLYVFRFVGDVAVPRSVPLIFILVAGVSLSMLRLGLKEIFTQHRLKLTRPVIVYGAGEAGRQLYNSLSHGGEYDVVAFVDDNSALHGADFFGVRVYGPSKLEQLIESLSVKIIILAVPRAEPSERKAILDKLESYPVQVKTMPKISDIVAGKASVGALTDISPEDLLGRDVIEPMPELMSQYITGKVVLVTGAGGSIGSELCRQIVFWRPSKLILLEHSEYALYSIEQELTDADLVDCDLVPILGSVTDGVKVEKLIQMHQVNTIYHAAAYKHVPLVEANHSAGILNNVFGTQTVAALAGKCAVEAFILISTDKAVRPTNIMGATKRLAELVCQALAKEYPKTHYVMVRFGNVLGSSGSVIPRFKAQIASGGPVTVTHPDITRYFMTIPEAAQLVIQAGALAQTGEVCVLDMGEPVKIRELAARLIKLSGHVPVTDTDSKYESGIPIVFTGLRPGEKLYEELLIGEASSATRHPRILKANEYSMPWSEFSDVLDGLKSIVFKEESSSAELEPYFEKARVGYRSRSRSSVCRT
jgi:FlaA1/EpsC-like NDP-sugar epimerase